MSQGSETKVAGRSIAGSWNGKTGERHGRSIPDLPSFGLRLIATAVVAWAGFQYSASAVTLESRRLEQVCSFAQPELRSTGAQTTLIIDDCRPFERVGAPVLPSRVLRILLPPGHRVVEVDAVPSVPVDTLAAHPAVRFGRLPVSSRTVPGQLEGDDTGPDPSVYGADGPYPSRRAALQSIQHLSGYSIALIRVFPVQYYPAAGRLEFAPELTLSITTMPEAQTRAVQSATASAAVRKQVAAFVDNPEALTEHLTAEAGSPRFQTETTVDYLLITKNELVDAFQPLLDQKTDAGLSVKAETVETISSTYPGQDLPEKIRNYLKAAHTDWGVQYLLLGGDTQTVPCRLAYARMDGLVAPGTSIPCDLYYACLDGSWNGNNNSLWGEPTDGDDGGDVDLLSELYVGRAPVDTPAEAVAFVTKSLGYQAGLHPGVTNAVFMAEFLKSFSTGPAQGADMFDPLLPFFQDFQVQWLDDRPFTTPQWTTDDALAALNSSPHLALYNGHGDTDLIMRMYTEHVALLTNTAPFLAYSVGCNAGEFDNDKFSADCIGEALVKRENAGAFAAILNSREGWYDPENEWKYSGEFQTRFFDRLLNQSQTNLGVANHLGRQDLVGDVETAGTMMTYRFCYYEINLLGDPHLGWQLAPLVPDDTDTDGDGMTDWQESIAGTDPNAAASVLALRVVAGGGSPVHFEWSSVPGRIYTLWRAAAPEGTFTVLAENLAATAPLNVYDDPEPAGGTWYYRLEVRQSP